MKSLSIMLSRSIHAVPQGKIFCFYVDEQYSIVLSPHLLMDTWAPPILTIIKNAAIDIGVLISFELIIQVSSDKFPEVESLGYKAVPFLIS